MEFSYDTSSPFSPYFFLLQFRPEKEYKFYFVYSIKCKVFKKKILYFKRTLIGLPHKDSQRLSHSLLYLVKLLQSSNIRCICTDIYQLSILNCCSKRK